jgi:membrane-associated protease RseP (regulator of RpoE activity)
MNARSSPESTAPVHEQRPRYALAFTLFALTCLSTTYVQTLFTGEPLKPDFAYSVPLMSILLAHELGHYIAARIHRVPASLPYFLPIPIGPLGTMGAVILMRGRIASRNALLDIGAAGPLAGLAVAVPVLAYGIAQSPVAPLPSSGMYFQEGHSLLYAGLLHLIKGPIPEGHDILLSRTAFAGWAGLLVTMLNLIPALQLDGGHVAYAALGERFHAVSRAVRKGILPLSLFVALYYGLPAYGAGRRGEALFGELAPATQWLVWSLLLSVMARGNVGREHPPVDALPLLSPARRVLAWFTLAMFALTFMPAWLRSVTTG